MNSRERRTEKFRRWLTTEQAEVPVCAHCECADTQVTVFVGYSAHRSDRLCAQALQADRADTRARIITELAEMDALVNELRASEANGFPATLCAEDMGRVVSRFRCAFEGENTRSTETNDAG